MTTVAFESAGEHFSGTLQGIYPFVFVQMLFEIGCSFQIWLLIELLQSCMYSAQHL
ncbi:hypothetical protein BDR06DRAFT_950709 [Suillus hirtellus]|nr:hypothetical protein BDR06DRAFT_950709 [Suillus hirtellus]